MRRWADLDLEPHVPGRQRTGDRDLRDRLATDVRALLHRLGTPAIHVTHDLAEAELVADRVVRLVATPAGASTLR